MLNSKGKLLRVVKCKKHRGNTVFKFCLYH